MRFAAGVGWALLPVRLWLAQALDLDDGGCWFEDRTGKSAHPTNERGLPVKQQVGFVLQFIVLTATPLISWWQLQFGFNLIWMPGLLAVAAVLFWIGTRLRESK